MYSPNNPWHCAHLPPDHVRGPDGGGAVAQRQHDLAPGQQPRPHPERAVVHDAVVTPEFIRAVGQQKADIFYDKSRYLSPGQYCQVHTIRTGPLGGQLDLAP